MKVMKDKSIPASVTQVHDYTVCDICKGNDKGVDCNFNHVEIECKDYEYILPECSSGTRYSYDICQECFVNEVIPALRQLGAVALEQECGH